SGERGAFTQRKIACPFAEITARRGFRAIKTAAEINPVEIKLQDLLLVEIVLNPASDKNLEKFAAKCFPFEGKTVARQLLRDRARALTHVSSDQVLECGAQDS